MTYDILYRLPQQSNRKENTCILIRTDLILSALLPIIAIRYQWQKWFQIIQLVMLRFRRKHHPGGRPRTIPAMRQYRQKHPPGDRPREMILVMHQYRQTRHLGDHHPQKQVITMAILLSLFLDKIIVFFAAQNRTERLAIYVFFMRQSISRQSI